ncbi:response regulator [Pedococcus sp. KACC 23699]|uniref:Response regulator n=1 Tax=Pedococcus sp. KACC 23699 TaxID=3149228 RepID=A0AAU7JXB2_9MICO
MTPGLPSGGPRRVLVVDDDELILEVAEMSLSMVGGWEVTTATGGQEALDRCATELPDAVVMDVMMPGMDGSTAAVLISQDPAISHIPVVLLTAKAQAAEDAQKSGLPVVGVLAKPFDPMTLPAQLSLMLGWTA